MKVKRITAFFLMAVMLVGMIGVSDTVYAENDDSTLVVGFDAEFPPYGYKDENGEYVGFDLDLAAEVCKRRGWTLVKQPIDWNSKDMELSSGSIDCIWNGFTINGRENEYTWSVPYVDNSQVVIVKRDSGIATLADLKGKVVVVQTDSSALAAFTGEGATEENIALCKSFSDLQQVADYNSAFMNLESGMVDAICMDIGVAKFQVESRGDAFVILEENVSSEAYGVGFKLGNEALRDEVQETLREMEADGTFAVIAKEWGLSDCICLETSFEELDTIGGTEESATDSETGVVKDGTSGNKLDIASIVKQLGQGMLATLTIFALTLLFALPLGLVIMFIRTSNFAPFRWLAKLYISIMRGTPLMLQLLVVFFGPYYLFEWEMPSSYRFTAVIIGFSLNYAAYFAEIYRSGIQSIPVGQREAALVLGYSRGQTFRKIIFPQMAKVVMPSVTNEVITLVKDTSLAFALAYTEMFTLAKQIAAAKTSIVPLFVAGIFYYVFNFLVAFVMEQIEKKMDYYKSK
ncbi:MAG: ABC transporter permease subunit [Lachnospiraceae bacterium]|nr:ABC transporter permease subunit [Lachnospiraceae bacterium]